MELPGNAFQGDQTRFRDKIRGMSAGAPHTTELAVKLRLSLQTSEKLIQRAAQSGRDVSSLAADLIEEAISRPTVDEVLAPFRKQVAESGLTDTELDDLHRDLLTKVRHEKQAKAS
jgi:pyruvate-formate lyase